MTPVSTSWRMRAQRGSHPDETSTAAPQRLRAYQPHHRARPQRDRRPSEGRPGPRAAPVDRRSRNPGERDVSPMTFAPNVTRRWIATRRAPTEPVGGALHLEPGAHRPRAHRAATSTPEHHGFGRTAGDFDVDPLRFGPRRPIDLSSAPIGPRSPPLRSTPPPIAFEASPHEEGRSRPPEVTPAYLGDDRGAHRFGPRRRHV